MNDTPLDAVGFDSSRGVGKHDFRKDETLLQRALNAAGYNVRTVDVTDWRALYERVAQENERLRAEINRLQYRLASKGPTYCGEVEQSPTRTETRQPDQIGE